jgi:hypothetical protein
MSIHNLQMAHARLRDVAKTYGRAIIDNCPIGATVKWEIGRYVQTGEVVRHDHWERVEVRNLKSGKVSWVYANRLIP